MKHTPNTYRFACFPLISTAVVALAGCGSLSGLSGSSEYGCKAPDGVQCDSVSGNYYNAVQNNLPSQRQDRQNRSSPDKAQPTRTDNKKALTATQPLPRSTYTPTSLRAQARVLRMWTKPWEDVDGALHDQGYVYLQTDHGRWLIDHAQRQIREAYLPVRLPRNVTAATTQSDSSPAVMRPNAHGPSDNTANHSIANTLDALRERGQAGSSGDDK